MNSLFRGTLRRDAEAIAVIMAGGSGTRFWPSSRRAFPKQFLSLAGEKESLIQATSTRLEPLVGKDGQLVVTAAAQVPLVEEHLPGIATLAEPMPRNTAPCIAYAAHVILQEVGDVPMIVLPSDHFIREEEGLLARYREAISIAKREDVLLTIGIPPTHPDTAYGYMQSGALRDDASGLCDVSRFVEKPDRETAEAYLASGNYYWNSGMFIWRPSVLLEALSQYVPELAQALADVAQHVKSADGAAQVEQVFSSISGVSVDVAVMEQANNVAMLPGTGFRWSDIGSWDAWAAIQGESEGSADGNVRRGDVMMIDCRDTVAVAKERFIAAVGLEGVLIVETEDAVLVCRGDRAQEVKQVVENLRAENKDTLL